MDIHKLPYMVCEGDQVEVEGYNLKNGIYVFKIQKAKLSLSHHS